MDPIAQAALLLAALAALWLMRQRRNHGTPSRDSLSGRSQRSVEALDTVAAWPPEATRVLTQSERRAHELLVKALPQHMVLAQLPVPRFIRVPTRNSYHEWLHRLSQLCADLVVCDASSQVIAVVEVRRPPGQDSERTLKRHARMDRVLRKAGIRVVVWNEDALPHVGTVREQVLGPAQAEKSSAPVVRSGVASDARAPASAVAALTEALSAGDLEVSDDWARAEPAPSTWFDELDTESARLHVNVH